MTMLCEIAKPNEGLLTNIGKEHLEGFGSIEGVAKAESELYDYLLKNGGLCYVNFDDPWLTFFETAFLLPRITAQPPTIDIFAREPNDVIWWCEGDKRSDRAVRNAMQNRMLRKFFIAFFIPDATS